ncbi:FUSC family protein [Endozoicomonas sp. SCSIO W0465]|uniref:FUSC family protein n=1 Tax=Endozoicomonas sp. SCSIO W0465 TaxID=2918516 RepID=UPI0020758309|nr:FUSC family protein [Endozoicomonas sp. SCSIO W0465]
MLAGLIALSTSLYFNLPYPSWGLLTIAFLAMKVELGNIYIKSLARIAGTVIGGVAGAMITVAFGQYPLLLIIALSLVVFVCVAFTSRYQPLPGDGGLCQLSGLHNLLAGATVHAQHQ